MAKVTIYLPDELAERVKASGVSMSPVCQRALQEEIEKMQTTEELKSKEERIVVPTPGPGDTIIERAFYGTWLVYPDPDESRTLEDNYDRGLYWGIALTRRGQIAVSVQHCNELRPPVFRTYSSLDEASNDLPPDLLAVAARELGEDRPIELDI